MSKREVTFTHRGWFGLCPVYVGDIKDDAPTVQERRFVPLWWFHLNELMLGACIFVVSLFDAEREPTFPLLITGELLSPIVIMGERDDS